MVKRIKSVMVYLFHVPKWNLQEIVNGALYLTKNGCMWRDLSGDFPPYQTVYWYFVEWVKDCGDGLGKIVLIMSTMSVLMSLKMP